MHRRGPSRVRGVLSFWGGSRRDEPHRREQAMLGGLPLLNPVQRRLFQAGTACAELAPKLKCALAKPSVATVGES
jgi:hypothetical protein